MDVEHFGSCHCGAVRWKFSAPKILDGIKCNCSICTKKQNNHVIIKKGRFELLQGADSLTTYTFNTGVAQHTFCKICGVQSFYYPRSNPEDMAIMPHCIDGNSVESINWTFFDGQNWETHIIKNTPNAL